ncbi:MAG: hypothetical protein LBE67_15615 [Kocuria palustris]|nr:hypothetical protein [Kocuria palustris]
MESTQVRAVAGVLFLLRVQLLVQLRFLEVVMTEDVSGRLIVIAIGVWCMRKVFFLLNCVQSLCSLLFSHIGKMGWAWEYYVRYPSD